MKLRQFIQVLIVAAGLWAYHNSFRGPFIFDDVTSIPENLHIRRLWPISEAMTTSPNLAVQGRPVECLTLALNYAWNGLDVRGYHAFNLMLHLASALVLFGLLRRTFGGEEFRDRLGNAAIWLAAAIALIWEVHPLQAECVDYIVQRSELLMGLFLLLTLYCTLRGSLSSRPRVWYLAAVASCALGMGSKEVMVGAPVVVFLYDRIFLASSFRELWRRRMSLYIGLGATWVLLAVLVGRTIHPATGFDIKGLTAWDYLMTEAGVIVHYLRLCFWPHPLVIDYFDWPISRSPKDALVPGLVVVSLLSATVWAFRRRPWLGFLGAWFFLILAPTSSILPSAAEAAAERRMYLPLAAVVTLTVMGAFTLGKRQLSRRPSTVVGCAAGAAVVALFSVLTIQRNQDYHSALTIWQDTVKKRPNNPRAHNFLGLALVQEGRLQDAIRHYEQAVRIQPDYVEAHNNLGVAFMEQYAEAHNSLGVAFMAQHRVREAMEQWEAVLRLKPDDAEVHDNLGNAMLQAGQIQEAIAHYEKALQIEPDYADAHSGLGLALEETGRLPEAIGHWEQALRINPDCAEAPLAHYNLGLALMGQGRLLEAIAHYEKALQIRPNHAEGHNNLGVALMRQGRLPEAIAHYERAVQIEPDYAEAHFNMGFALEKLGSTQEAIQHYEQALRIKPDFVEVQKALARARAAH